MAHLSLVSTFGSYKIFFSNHRETVIDFFFKWQAKGKKKAKISDTLGHLLMCFNILVSPPQIGRTTRQSFFGLEDAEGKPPLRPGSPVPI